MKIFLIGYRGTGKTTVGRILADRLAYFFSDIDRKIEKETKSTIRTLVELYGWAYFRQLEQKALFSTRCCEHLVVSTGGGIVSDPENIDFILANGFCVWLKADINTILLRLSSDPETKSLRPMLTDKDLVEETKAMLAMRTPLYEKAAHMSIDTVAHSPEEISMIIERSLT